MIAALFASERARPRDIHAWWALSQTMDGPPIERAILGGFHADRLAFAFASGYQAAGQALFGAPADLRFALCATEGGSAHPRAIQTRLDDGKVSGNKDFVTFGPLANRLYVVASVGVEAGRNRLKIVTVDPDQPGVQILPPPTLPFVPEIPHARVVFEDAVVESVLEGDGYTRYLKPFRTVEDLHVHAAVLGSVFGETRDEALLPLLHAARDLAQDDPTDPATHLALGALIEATRSAVEDLTFEDPETQAAWARDRPLLSVAGTARAARLANARQSLGSNRER